MFRQPALLLWIFLVAAATAADPWAFESIEGERIEPFADARTQALVAVFISVDCPVANYFQPTLRRLQEKYGARGVRFVFFHPDPDVNAAAARKHVEDYRILAPVVLDPGFAVARRLDAEYTPEAFLIGRGGEIHYRGRINDIYVDWGKKRRAPRHEDLDQAIAAVLKGEKISSPRTKPVGCYIAYPAPEVKEK